MMAPLDPKYIEEYAKEFRALLDVEPRPAAFFDFRLMLPKVQAKPEPFQW